MKSFCFACNHFIDEALEICGSELTHYVCPVCNVESRMMDIKQMVAIIKSIWTKEQIDLYLEGKIEIPKKKHQKKKRKKMSKNKIGLQ